MASASWTPTYTAGLPATLGWGTKGNWPVGSAFATTIVVGMLMVEGYHSRVFPVVVSIV